MDILARAKGLILKPAEEWHRIAAEPADTRSLFTGYAMPMAALPAVAGFIGSALFAGFLGDALGVRVGIFALLLNAIAGYLLGLGGVWVWGKLIEALAPRFGGAADATAAMKLAVYTPTAAWLAGIAAILPPLAILALFGLYSLYLFWKGAPIIVGVPQDRMLAFTATLILIGFVVNLMVGLFAGLFLRF